MSTLIKPLTYHDLEHFPDDGLRREIIDGELYVSPAPLEIHQFSLGELYIVVRRAVMDTGWGRVYFAPVDVRFADNRQVQPDLIVIRTERRHIYQGNTVHGAPDIVVEIISPSNPSYDEVEKLRLYEAAGVPEFWLVDPAARTFRMLALRDGRYVPIEPIAGLLHSTVVPGLTIDPAALFAALDR